MNPLKRLKNFNDKNSPQIILNAADPDISIQPSFTYRGIANMITSMEYKVAKPPFSEIFMPVTLGNREEAFQVFDIDSNTWSLVRKEAEDDN